MNCKECGKEIDFRYLNEGELRAGRLCFNCNFWTEIVNRPNDGRDVVVGGVKYYIGHETEATPSNRRGYGGRKFVIETHGGERIETVSLWCEGTVPARFRDRLPDNAKFVGASA